jgi:hypothetical protein
LRIAQIGGSEFIENPGAQRISHGPAISENAPRHAKRFTTSAGRLFLLFLLDFPVL